MKESNTELTICARCKHMQKPASNQCYARCKAKPKMDYVTGELDYWTCSGRNSVGNCPDYAALVQPAPAGAHPPRDADVYDEHMQRATEDVGIETGGGG